MFWLFILSIPAQHVVAQSGVGETQQLSGRINPDGVVYYDLPRLGYLTFVDTILISTFVITAFVVVFNVILKRLELAKKERLVARLDTPMIWLYPLFYLLLIAIAVRHFFLLT